MSRARAFTLVELLAVVVLLGAIASAGAALLSMAGRAAGAHQLDASDWERSAFAAFQLMQDDLHAVDIPAESERSVARVRDGALRIRTRRSFSAWASDGITHEYLLDRDQRRLEVVESRSGASAVRRPLLNDVRRIEVDLSIANRTAHVAVESVDGLRLSRVLRVP
jgi:prepilin-type N-terminal cleavage/methylation domain-containing protein